MSSNFKITYSALNADMSAVHAEFDKTMAALRFEFVAPGGKEVPSVIAGKEIKTGKFNVKKNPANLSETVGKYHTVGEVELNTAFETARRAQVAWGATSWEERIRITRKAADIMRDRKFRNAVLMTLEVGKNRMESLGDAEEAADLLSYYAQQLEDHKGFSQPLAKLSPNEDTRDVLRPYGVFAVIAPFNFPMALGAGMASAALLGGNSVILKPSDDAPATAYEIYRAYKDAGLPEGVLQVVFGQGPPLGEAMVKHPMCDGAAFTGSKTVGMSILRNYASGPFMKPALMELGGKNPTFVTQSADLDKAAQGCVRSAFGLTGQKCSALSRLYVHEAVYEAFMKKLIAKASETVKIGDPARQEIYMGPIINEKAVIRHLGAIDEAVKNGKIVFGGTDLRKKAEFAQGHFVDPTIAELPATARHFKDEFFSPFLAVTKFKDLKEAITLANNVEYGLTAGIFTEDKNEIQYFMDHIEAGVLYANRATGATTGAWPGVQSFCGWKGSGSTGKGGCGPYYVSQFMREQSRTIMG
ncbi:MAG: aldehyde dehydrogenase family protein [Bdellovibrionales bacterium]|nr:aldehyde dehydrogenase family protein [Bdellovibrionales bacterium]